MGSKDDGCLGEAFRRMMEEEEKITLRVDPDGAEWRKVYVGGGEHFRSWLEQCRELGEVMVEEIEPFGQACFGEGGEKLYRIWVRIDPRKNAAP